MFIERNVFLLKFGKAGEALRLWRSFFQEAKSSIDGLHVRLLTDVSGKSYTLVLELGYESFAELEPAKCMLTQLPQWKEFYKEFILLCESSERTLYKTEISIW